MMPLLAVSEVPWSDISVGVAAVVGLVYVARTMRSVTRDTLDGVTTRQTEMLNFMGNHMSKQTEALTNLAVTSQMLVDKVDVLHDDNIATAAELIRQGETLRAERRYGRLTKSGARADGDVEDRYARDPQGRFAKSS